MNETPLIPGGWYAQNGDHQGRFLYAPYAPDAPFKWYDAERHEWTIKPTTINGPIGLQDLHLVNADALPIGTERRRSNRVVRESRGILTYGTQERNVTKWREAEND